MCIMCMVCLVFVLGVWYVQTRINRRKEKTHTHTCEMLMKEPLEPASAMAFTALRSFRLTCADVPDSSRAVFSTLSLRQSSIAKREEKW